jgi:hypothetical protein
MQAIRVQQTIVKDGEILIEGMPYQKGQVVEVIVLPRPTKTGPRTRLTVRHVRESGLIGLWKDRDDIQDSAAYARHLRAQAQNRGIKEVQ